MFDFCCSTGRNPGIPMSAVSAVRAGFRTEVENVLFIIMLSNTVSSYSQSIMCSCGSSDDFFSFQTSMDTLFLFSSHFEALISMP